MSDQSRSVSRIIMGGGAASGPGQRSMQPGQPRDPNFQDVYSNQIRMSVNPTDINIIFSALIDRGPGVFAIEDRASIRIAPMVAKILLLHLQMVMECYEQVLGEVKVPPQILQLLEFS